MTQTCSQCGIHKEDKSFRMQKGRGKRRANCNSCETLRQKKWKDANREKAREYDRNRYREYPDRWAAHILRSYGLTLDDYESMFRSQNGLCAICGTSEPGGNSSRLHVDHDHETGEIRGLLCLNCNRMLGYGKDSLAIFAKASEYLSLPRSRKRS